MEIEEGVICRGRKLKVDNTLRDFHVILHVIGKLNSIIILFYYSFKIIPSLKT